MAKNLTWLIFPDNKPPRHLNLLPLSASSFKNPPAQDFKICWLGHSSLIMEFSGTRFAMDPVFKNASPFPGIVRRYGPSPLSREDLPPLDYLIISHDHYDHLERSTIRYLIHAQPQLKFVTCLGVGGHLRRWGVPGERIVELNWGEDFCAGTVKIYCVPSRHFSGRFFNTRCQTLWGAFVLESGHRRIFLGADGGYGTHFKALGKRFAGGFDLALFEIDAWSEKWRQIHMTPEEAVLAGTELGARCIMPIHWATFYLAQHPWTESIERFLSAATARGVTVAFPRIGEIMSLGEAFPQNFWWREIKK
ncbi:MAG: MBL fold metallo-hydrolase [Opitutales bacterium]|nr:MBL fold metallo-hydrolase [Opitutales bacterium]